MSLYNELKRLAESQPDVDKFRWFEKSYAAFKSSPLNNSVDLIRLTAFAYSWMPTMADFKSEFAEAHIETLIAELSALTLIMMGDDFEQGRTKFQSVLDRMFDLINKSIVGTSKVLHFAYPDLFPIFDSRVIYGWNRLFNNTAQNRNFKISTYVLSSKQKAISVYVDYTFIMLKWLEVIKVTKSTVDLRELEVLLYRAGSNTF